jgi:CheY-like chemotaxis protein
MSFSRQAESKPSALNVGRLLEETVFILRRSIDRRIQIHFVPPGAELWNTAGDQDQFTQVVMNLCLNARDAMPDGGELTIGCVNCSFDPQTAQPPRHPGEFVRVTVSDTGHGMTKEVLTRLFEPYFSTKGFGKGAGLGLSIANHVVVEHGGWMEVESEWEKGSHFHVYLPRTTAVAEAPKLKEHRMDGDSVLKGSETILLADDENSIRSVMIAALSYRGYKVLEAVDGEEAVQRYRESGKDIDLVLLDIQMPRLNGWDAMESILSINPKARVLLLSGGAPIEPKPGAAELAAGILLKPFQNVQLLRSIREALDVKKTN